MKKLVTLLLVGCAVVSLATPPKNRPVHHKVVHQKHHRDSLKRSSTLRHHSTHLQHPVKVPAAFKLPTKRKHGH